MTEMSSFERWARSRVVRLLADGRARTTEEIGDAYRVASYEMEEILSKMAEDGQIEGRDQVWRLAGQQEVSDEDIAIFRDRIDPVKFGGAMLGVTKARYQQEKRKAQGRFKFICADEEMPIFEKLAALASEFGEVADEALTLEGLREPRKGVEGTREALRGELEQVAAVAVAWLESLSEPEEDPGLADSMEKIAEVLTCVHSMVVEPESESEPLTTATEAIADLEAEETCSLPWLLASLNAARKEAFERRDAHRLQDEDPAKAAQALWEDGRGHGLWMAIEFARVAALPTDDDQTPVAVNQVWTDQAGRGLRLKVLHIDVETMTITVERTAGVEERYLYKPFKVQELQLRDAYKIDRARSNG